MYFGQIQQVKKKTLIWWNMYSTN